MARGYYGGGGFYGGFPPYVPVAQRRANALREIARIAKEDGRKAAPVKIDRAYTTPYQHSAPMEPHASMAFWEGEMLTVRFAEDQITVQAGTDGTGR